MGEKIPTLPKMRRCLFGYKGQATQGIPFCVSGSRAGCWSEEREESKGYGPSSSPCIRNHTPARFCDGDHSIAGRSSPFLTLQLCTGGTAEFAVVVMSDWARQHTQKITGTRGSTVEAGGRSVDCGAHGTCPDLVELLKMVPS